MKEKMPKGVRFLFFILSILFAGIGFYVTLNSFTAVGIIVIAVFGLVFALVAILISKGKKRKVMVFPVLVGLLFTIIPLGAFGVAAIKVANQNKSNSEDQKTPGGETTQYENIPSTYYYTDHYVSSPDAAVINKAEYYDRYEMLNQTYSLSTNEYSGSQLSYSEYTLGTGPREQTGRFEELTNPNYQFDVNNIKSTYARIPYGQYVYSPSRYFNVTSTIGALDLTDTDALEDMFFSDNCYLSVYPYRDFSITLEFYKDFSFDGIELRVSQYIYFNDYGYPEREEILWAAHCDDVYSSSFVDQKVLVYNYAKKVTTNEK